MTIARAVKDYLRYIDASRGLSLNTIKNYQRYLIEFTSWAETNKVPTIEAVTADDIIDFQLSLSSNDTSTKSRQTINYYLIALRSMLKYLLDRDLTVLPPDKITLSKIPERQIHWLSTEEMTRLLDAAPTETLSDLRDKAMIAVLFSSGLRVSELMSLKRNQVSLMSGEFSVRGKGGKVRPVFLSPSALEILGQYMDARADTNPNLFIRHFTKSGLDSNKRPLGPRTLQRTIGRLARAAGITKPVSPHKIRHSFATDLLRNGADIRSVQALLGHSSITTTQLYTHVTDKSLRDIHHRFHSPQSDPGVEEPGQS